MTEYTLTKLSEMVKEDGAYYEDYRTAITYCQQAIAAGEDYQTWLMQIGYLYFQADQGKYHYDYTGSIFQTLVIANPTDINARFWLGYTAYMLYHQYDVSERELRCVLEMNPDHPYANLTLVNFIEGHEMKAHYLRRVLTAQETNLRAHKQLADSLIAMGEYDETIAMLESVSALKPYVEHDYGIMNDYVNHVFTGADKPRWQQEVEQLLEKAKNPPRRLRR